MAYDWLEHWGYELSRWLLGDHEHPVIAHPRDIRNAERMIKEHDRTKCTYCTPLGGNGDDSDV